MHSKRLSAGSLNLRGSQQRTRPASCNRNDLDSAKDYQEVNMLRDYQTSDFDDCIAIVDQVWDFSNRFQPQSLVELFLKIYVGGSLAASNFAAVCEEEGIVKGFLFGNSGRLGLYETEYSGFWGNLAFLRQFLLLKGVPLKKKLFYLKIIGKHEQARTRIESSRDNEVNLFAVAPNTQGKGFGKLLMNEYITFCQNNNARRVTLETDKECNYKFYEHFGFTIKGEFYSALQKEYSGKSGDSFVYELIL